MPLSARAKLSRGLLRCREGSAALGRRGLSGRRCTTRSCSTALGIASRIIARWVGPHRAARPTGAAITRAGGGVGSRSISSGLCIGSLRCWWCTVDLWVAIVHQVTLAKGSTVIIIIVGCRWRPSSYHDLVLLRHDISGRSCEQMVSKLTAPLPA